MFKGVVYGTKNGKRFALGSCTFMQAHPNATKEQIAQEAIKDLRKQGYQQMRITKVV